MTLKEFSTSLNQVAPPEGVNIFLQALWFEARGDWDKAHVLVQDEENSDGAWIHAYLHRKEGDISNAGYWYRRAGKTMSRESLSQEWEDIVKEFLSAI